MRTNPARATLLVVSRIARVVLEEIPYHITQRGNARWQVFFDERVYELYLDLLGERARKAGLRILAYCLMPNHVHLIVVPERENLMAAALGRTHADFARHFNLRKRACGHVSTGAVFFLSARPGALMEGDGLRWAESGAGGDGGAAGDRYQVSQLPPYAGIVFIPQPVYAISNEVWL